MVLNIVLNSWISNAGFAKTNGISAKMASNSLVGMASDMQFRESDQNHEVCTGTVTDVAASTRHKFATLTRTQMLQEVCTLNWLVHVCNEKRPLQLPVKAKV